MRTCAKKAYLFLKNGLGGAAALAAAATFTVACLDRPVAPAVPTTSNVYIDQIRQVGVDKIDLLFMIDNSVSMADKQQILSQAVPVLLDRLISPICVDAEGAPSGGRAPSCAGGSRPEFAAIEDIHIGVITSSIGDHGSGGTCAEASAEGNRTLNDKAQLVATVYSTLSGREDLPSWDDQGFLVWDPRAPEAGVTPHDPPGYDDRDELVAAFRNHVTAAGEDGCGYEAQLEAWYRFLIDPEPVEAMSNDGWNSVRPKGADGLPLVNQTVLAQRAAFLRPDSLVAIVMLTDENDCSILDEDLRPGFAVGFGGDEDSWRMARATSSCFADPNDSSCRPCEDGDTDAECLKGEYTPFEDDRNLRCYRQKQRFGIDLLYPTRRYVEALTLAQIDPRLTGRYDVQNPLFATPPGRAPRDPGLVFLAGIVGVPWQDIATADTLNAERDLEFMTAEEIHAAGRWDVILGDPGIALDPTDPFMIESAEPRPTGLSNPIVPSATILPPTSTTLNAINGHEQAVIVDREIRDLQFACTFPLATPVPCTDVNRGTCDCDEEEYAESSPLCSYPAPNVHGTQERAKAYPGLRELEVLKGLGSKAIVASICPKNIEPAPGTDAASDPSYGYNPAVAAIVGRLKDALTAKCLPRPLVPEDRLGSPELGKVPCAVIEVRPEGPSGCEACDETTGRSALEGEEAKIIPAVLGHLRDNGLCDVGGTACVDFCPCKLRQFTQADDTNGESGPDLMECVSSSVDPGGLYGYCYVDPTVDVDGDGDADANPALLEACGATEKRMLRFLGANVPAKDGVAVIACVGDAASSPTTFTAEAL